MIRRFQQTLFFLLEREATKTLDAMPVSFDTSQHIPGGEQLPADNSNNNPIPPPPQTDAVNDGRSENLRRTGTWTAPAMMFSSSFHGPALSADEDNGWNDETENGVKEFVAQAAEERDYFHARTTRYAMGHRIIVILILLLSPLGTLTSGGSLVKHDLTMWLILVSFLSSGLVTALMVIDQKWNPGRKQIDNLHRTNQLKFFIQWIHLEMAVPRYQRVHRDELWKLMLHRYSSILLHFTSSSSNSMVSPSAASGGGSQWSAGKWRQGSGPTSHYRPWWERDVPLNPPPLVVNSSPPPPIDVETPATLPVP